MPAYKAPPASIDEPVAANAENAGRAVYTLADLRDWPAATADAKPPLRLAVLGDPIAHSASPPMQNAALAAGGIDARYTRLHIRPDELAEAFRLIARAGFIGVNLTIPHKVAAMSLLDEVDPHAAALGAVNTVLVNAAGRLHGFNTDGPGFEQAVHAEFGVDLRGLRVLILGAGGGAGRALAAQCALAGCPRLVLVNRTVEKVHTLAETLRRTQGNNAQISALAWETPLIARALQEVDLVVNASSIGLKAGAASPLADTAISSRLLVFDTVYRADGHPTPLVAAARANGAKTTGGMSLLLYQGALAFEHWFSQTAPFAAMRRALENA